MTATSKPTLPIAALEREDVVLFINAASTCSGQSEFYGDASDQRVTLAFLHDYVFGNYRRLYALCLAAGINHYNQALVVEKLLAAGAPVDPSLRAQENALITEALRRLPPQRVYRLFVGLRRSRVNNRRTRAIVRDWLGQRDLAFDALKYRGPLRAVSRHSHIQLPSEVHHFLVGGAQSRKAWSHPLLDAARRAKFDQRALYELPFTVAEGLAAAQGIDRKTFLKRIAPNMTTNERARLDRHIGDRGADVKALDFRRLPLTKLATLLLSRPIAEREPLREPMRAAAARLAQRGLELPPRVCAVLDRSYSSRAGAQKRNRTLAVTLAISQLLAAASTTVRQGKTPDIAATDTADAASIPDETRRAGRHGEVGGASSDRSYRAFWTGASGPIDELALRPKGQTNLAAPLLAALRTQPDLVIIVSDGFENDPPGAIGEVVRLFREHIDPIRPTDGVGPVGSRTSLVHLNPVFDAESFMPRPLGPSVPTVGIRDASELALKLGFARFASGQSELPELRAWLEDRAQRLFARTTRGGRG